MFILDESNMLESGFLERMNTLLANGEVQTFMRCHPGRVDFAKGREVCLYDVGPVGCSTCAALSGD